ncbi:Pleckstrin homology domain-containing family A member 8 [Schistosoma japonicum]|nr:Pleckstrin homology domain-containing family A member 8 [Schistosoma japonicum]KAH8857311.1 Pleckstrin homology domain-containing family A member 8 [Schistosoma japonicum]KAH8857312.1 Pleckstrin homology domain-containing family A member 8 [Schistosoma japonicum]
MEGVLLKWTNYLSGWQQRYFILDDGVLSYYRSKEEMNSGCKGSVKLSVCDVIVHSSDPRKFDLILGEQRYYLRALSQSDRQRWIVALGSSKVGTTLLKAEDVNIYEPSQTQLIDNHRSELRLYHNLMVQQVKDIQSQLKEGTIPDMTRIDELTSMLNASCSTFLIALDELMILSNAQAPWLSSIVAGTNLETSPATFRNINTDSTELHSPNMGNNVYSSLTNDSILRNSHTQSFNRRHLLSTSRKYQTFFSTLEYSFEDIKPSTPVPQKLLPENDDIKLPGDYISALEFVKACKCLLLFLNRLNNNTTNSHFSASRTYTALQQVRNHLVDYLRCIEIHVELHASSSDEDHDDSHGDSTVKDIKSVDDQQNCIKTKNCDILFKKAQLSLGYLLRYEVKHKAVVQESNSVYMAILWLCRWLNFVREFLHHLFHAPDPFTSAANSDTSLLSIANEAYTRCIRPFHSWSVRGMAMVIIQSLPSRIYLLDLLLLDNPDTRSPSSSTATTTSSALPESFINESPIIRYPESYIQLKLDATRYSEALGRFLTLIEGLLASLDLNRIFTGSESY